MPQNRWQQENRGFKKLPVCVSNDKSPGVSFKDTILIEYFNELLTELYFL